MGHKSPSSLRWKSRQDRLEILEQRKMVRLAASEGTQSHWPDLRLPRRDEYESTGHYHWRLCHKNLARPIYASGRARQIQPPVES